MMPIAYTKKFIPIVWATFFARVRPVSTSAKPACMNMTRKPQSIVHTMLSAVCVSARFLASVASVGSIRFGLLGVESLRSPIAAVVPRRPGAARDAQAPDRERGAGSACPRCVHGGRDRALAGRSRGARRDGARAARARRPRRPDGRDARRARLGDQPHQV